MRRLLLAALLLTALGAAKAAAQTAAGAESFDFLNLDANARAVGLGGAYTALSFDSNALLYNPAGLGRTTAHEVTFMHNQYLQGLTQEYMGLATKQGFGAQLNYLQLSGVTRTRLDAPNGTLGTAAMSDLALSLGYGVSFLERSVSVGVAGKFLREDIDRVSATGGAADLGVLFTPEELPGLSFGVSLMNLGPNVRFIRDRSPLPSTGRAGAAYTFGPASNRTTATFDVTKTRSDRVRAGAGIETTVAGILAIRGGFTTRNDADVGVTGGFGIMLHGMSADYAFSPYGDLGFAHRMSLTFRWGSEASAETASSDEAPVKKAAPKKPARELHPMEPRRQPLVTEQAPPPPPLPIRPTIGAVAATFTVDERFERVDRAIASRSFGVARAELAAIDADLSAKDPLRVRYHERLGAVNMGQGDCMRARASYAEAIRSASVTGFSGSAVAGSYAGIGFCLLEEGNSTYAAKFFNKALEAGPSPGVRRNVENALMELRQR